MTLKYKLKILFIHTRTHTHTCIEIHVRIYVLFYLNEVLWSSIQETFGRRLLQCISQRVTKKLQLDKNK